MAHYEYVKDYSFATSAEVPFSYVCGKCGKEVTGKATIRAVKKAKVSSRHQSGLQMKEETRAHYMNESLYELRGKISAAKKAVKSGNFDMLYEHIKCPYCGAEQKWKYRYGRAITFAILALATVAIDILCIIIYSKQVRRGETDKTFLLCAFFLLLWIAVFTGISISEIKGIRATKSQALNVPKVYFDQMTSAWMDRLGY